MGNIIKVNFDPDKYFIWGIQGLEQWDQGQKLEISGLDISDEIVEVHFSLDEFQGKAERMYGTVKDGVIHADIPVFILEGPEYLCSNSEVYNAYAWVYVSDEESAETIRKMEFEIKARPKPNGYASPDKQDPFLQEIRRVMNETKDIAQSVREDADNGAFDGERGEKGDAGSIKFKIVPTLPTDDFDASIMYLVPSPTEEDENRFLEYVFIDGKPEIIGSASVEVNLDEYVKKTDYATQNKVGLVYAHNTRGISVLTDGGLIIAPANKDNVDGRNSYNPITGSVLDYAVKKALSDCKLTGDDAWTEEEKTLARTLIGSVGFDDVAIQGDIKTKTDNKKYLTSKYIDLIVKQGLANCKLTGGNVWTEEEKEKALELLGIVLCEFGTPIQGRVAVLGSGGQLSVGTPTMYNSATPKKYVDDLVGSVETILTELHTYAQTKIGGEA